MKKRIFNTLLAVASLLPLYAQETVEALTITGSNTTPSVNGFQNKLQFSGSRGAFVFNAGQTSELMFGMNSDGGFYWGTGQNATNPNFYPMILEGGTGNLSIRGLLSGGIGARTTGGVNDWNDISNIRSGSGYSLLRGNAPNGPDDTPHYYHPFNFEYGQKNGTGNVTQLAIPYGRSASIDQGIKMRGRYDGSWTSWVRVLSENLQGNVGIGTDEPSEKLEVLSTIKITNPADRGSSRLYIDRGPAGKDRALIGFGAGGNYGWFTGLLYAGGNNNGNFYISQTDYVKNADGRRDAEFAINTEGNVGIGTAFPDKSLYVLGDLGTAIRRDSEATGANVGIKFGVDDGDILKSGIIHVRDEGVSNGRGSMQFLVDASDDASDIAASDVKMSIASSGNVGIGRTDPQYALDVGNTDFPPARFNRNGNGMSVIFSRSDVKRGFISTNSQSTNALDLVSYGDLGLGTNGELDKLTIDTEGNTSITGNLSLGAEGVGRELKIHSFVNGQHWSLSPGTNTLSFKDWEGQNILQLDGVNNRVIFNSAFDIQGEQLAIESATGNVGIGTSAPGAKLVVNGGEIWQSYGTSKPQIGLTSNANQAIIRFNQYWKDGYKYSEGGGAAEISVGTAMNQGDMYFKTAPNGEADSPLSLNTRMTIREDGNIGIGTTTPNHKLQIGKNEHGSTSGPTNAFFNGTGFNMSLYSDQDFNADGVTGQLTFGSKYNSVGTFTAGARIYGYRPNFQTDGNYEYALGIDTRRHGASAVRAVTIRGDGNMGIGTDSPSSKLELYDVGNATELAIRFKHYSGVTGEIQSKFVDPASRSESYLSFSTNPDGAFSGLSEKMRIMGNGNVGIGTTSPSGSLSSNETGLHIQNDNVSFLALESTEGRKYSIYSAPNGSLVFWDASQTKMRGIIDADGDWGIGTTAPDAKLTVDGDIRATKVKVVADVNSVPDYVFSEDYNLQSLEEVEAYVKENSHLPEVPSAEEIAEHGLDIGAMNLILLKKIEELTLHMIHQNERLNKLERENARLKEQSQPTKNN